MENISLSLLKICFHRQIHLKELNLKVLYNNQFHHSLQYIWMNRFISTDNFVVISPCAHRLTLDSLEVVHTAAVCQLCRSDFGLVWLSFDMTSAHHDIHLDLCFKFFSSGVSWTSWSNRLDSAGNAHGWAPGLVIKHSYLSRFLISPAKAHLQAAKSVLRYMKISRSFGQASGLPSCPSHFRTPPPFTLQIWICEGRPSKVGITEFLRRSKFVIPFSHTLFPTDFLDFCDDSHKLLQPI